MDLGIIMLVSIFSAAVGATVGLIVSSINTESKYYSPKDTNNPKTSITYTNDKPENETSFRYFGWIKRINSKKNDYSFLILHKKKVALLSFSEDELIKSIDDTKKKKVSHPFVVSKNLPMVETGAEFFKE